MTSYDDIINKIQGLFEKKPNTIYEIRIVNEKYSGNVNIFFEYYKIGYATTSEQIGRYDISQKDKMSDLAKQITKETKVSVSLVGF